VAAPVVTIVTEPVLIPTTTTTPPEAAVSPAAPTLTERDQVPVLLEQASPPAFSELEVAASQSEFAPTTVEAAPAPASPVTRMTSIPSTGEPNSANPDVLLCSLVVASMAAGLLLRRLGQKRA